jgi:hypothetical protein
MIAIEVVVGREWLRGPGGASKCLVVCSQFRSGSLSGLSAPLLRYGLRARGV